MQIEFAPAKDAGNQAKHGVSLALDERYEYGELRMIALAPETRVLYYVAFIDRGEVRRVMSLRRATRREVKHYVESF